jgi:hypothetical protein
MKMKLSYSEFSVLYKLLQVVNDISPKGIQAQVLHGVMFRLFKKFYIKAIRMKNRYTMTIDADEACAFWMFFERFDMSTHDVFTQNLVRQLSNSIHKKYFA